MPKRRNLPINIVSRFEKNHDLKFWLSKTPEERIEAVEFLRSQHYALEGFKSTPRFIPHIEIRKRK
jgi:hypothetical protein